MIRGDRVRRLRTAKGWTQADLVDAVQKAGGKLSQGQLSAIEKGDVDRPGALVELVAVLDTTEEFLLDKATSETERAPRRPNPLQQALDLNRPWRQYTRETKALALDRAEEPPAQTVAAIPTLGEVAAGVWLDVDVEMDPRDIEQFPIAALPDFPINAQFGLIVRGTSMNKVFSAGEVLHCVDIIKAQYEPEENDIVIVERKRAQASQREVTAKRIHKSGRMIVLSPDSTDAKWKPIEFDPEALSDDESVEVIAVVVGRYTPLTRRRR